MFTFDYVFGIIVLIYITVNVLRQELNEKNNKIIKNNNDVSR